VRVVTAGGLIVDDGAPGTPIHWPGVTDSSSRAPPAIGVVAPPRYSGCWRRDRRRAHARAVLVQALEAQDCPFVDRRPAGHEQDLLERPADCSGGVRRYWIRVTRPRMLN
jgi:hypothetical protein